jgi:type II secretory pathway predicted ATPase ExeA
MPSWTRCFFGTQISRRQRFGKRFVLPTNAGPLHKKGRPRCRRKRVYLEYYGLKEPPFNITPNPRFLFFSAKHREAFNHLLYGIRERKGFVQLTGEVGAGKTTLCRALLEQLGPTFPPP